MPLTPEAGAPVRFEQSVNFPMRAGEQPASIQITYEWLEANGGDAAASPEVQVDEVRSKLESLASAKYDQGDFVLGEGVVVVKIRSGDRINP